MSPTVFFILLALLAGFSVPTQAGINAQLNLWTRSPVLASAISFAVGTLALVVYTLVARIPLPSLGTLSGHPWWIWIGGCLGAFFVASTVILAPKLGATTMVALILAGQMVASLLLDHFGWLGYPLHPISLGRIAGVLLLCAGIWLIRYF
ncbi:membrane protein [Desulfuromonas versatilis]|uniref:Membrane protein n=1 Tax=Desulfuromonas versatilis TaxID=2802975 RepID=A0ABN6DX71_9BACT|nr:DMT family transporter [Desulfuromonas versatilis]BCR04469.1 membrane protein [Desulfuromonas versatilis]